MLFNKIELRDMVYDDSKKLLKVKEVVEDIQRWSINYKTIFKNLETGKFYVTHYSKGATEYQDEEPYDFEPEQIECNEVECRKVMAHEWFEI